MMVLKCFVYLVHLYQVEATKKYHDHFHLASHSCDNNLATMLIFRVNAMSNSV